MKYSVIGDEDIVLGFGIVGVSGKVATNTEQAKRAFQALLEDKNIGIIIITERVADMMRSTVDKYLFRIGSVASKTKSNSSMGSFFTTHNDQL